MKTALLIIDVQSDFLPGGALAVPGGDAVIAEINRRQHDYDLVVATQDWHPQDHLSFASQHPGHKPFETIDLDGLEQILWPDHCVWQTEGAAFASGLNLGRCAAIFRKGMDRRVDSYSGFFDNGRRHATGLEAYLRALEVDAVDIAGLAADVCVAFTAEDAARAGFTTRILLAATRPIDEKSFADKKAELADAGVTCLAD
ncbi:MAG: bifunctional nicotinamidase/pyrazinamidase [Puniceicoccaceae bacterium]|nr:MAG: bifunctional nicotinamidase/pyrazinamidase [Puniceicoccaceae bacterium]